MIFALDTNIVSYALKGLFALDSKIDRILEEGNQIIIPPVTFYESLRGLFAVDATSKLNAFNLMCRQLGLVDMEQADWVQAANLFARLKKIGHPIEDSDLLQAAFCIRHRYTLVTHNTKHFAHIADLSIADWIE
jgi:tRNA(fMet)-specific endonuclease VapC